MRVLAPRSLNTSVVFASPHSGRDYTARFLAQSVLDAHVIRSSEDAFVDQLFTPAPEFGAPLLLADVPRAYVDLNRDIGELDRALIADAPPLPQNARVAAGLGVIPRVVAEKRAIYSGKLSMKEARERLNSHWLPYHVTLQGLLDQAKAKFGQAILIDCHSMPENALSDPRIDVVLGDRFAASADTKITDQLEAIFTDAGFKVARNTPFAGAYCTHHYGRPGLAQHAVQVEINRALYMDEAAIKPHEGFLTLCAQLRGVIAAISEMGQTDIEADIEMAAE